MKKSKRSVALLLVVIMICGLFSGCGKKEEKKATDTAATAEATTETTVATTDAATEDTAPTGATLGVSADSPYASYGLDLSEQKNVVMYALGDRPADMDKVLEELNSKYLVPWLNTTLEMQFLNWSDYTTKYSLVLAGGDTVDLMYTASWCYYNDEAGKGAFKELDAEWLSTYMPISYPQQPAESWDQISIGGKIFAVPKSNASFNGYNFLAARTDMLEKYGIESISSWDDMKKYFYAVAENETGIKASGMTSNRDELSTMWQQKEGVETLATGYDFKYLNKGVETAPNFDSDVFYWYTSDSYLNFCLEMAEMAEKGVWSSNAINDTNESRLSFENGTAASFIWNETIYDAGKALETAGLGEYVAFDVTPDAARKRGSYADDAVAIASSSKDPERAAIVLDCLKGFPEVNNLILGGVEGTNYDLNEDGTRTTLDGAANYAWNGWAWGIQRGDQPLESGIDARRAEFRTLCEANEYVPQTAGFTFDKTAVEMELSVINSIRDEYITSFFLGVYGDKTEAKITEFREKLQAAGLDTITAELKTQYEAYCQKKGY